MLYLVSILKSLSKAPYILQLCELWVGWCEYNRIIWDTEYTRTISSTFVISCLGYEVAWLDQVGPVGNKIMTVIWVSVVSQISVRTSNGPCLLPNSWSGAGFYAFSFTSHVHWVIIQWRWLTQSLGPGPATSHVEISEFFIKGSMTGWIRKMWACCLRTSNRHADRGWSWWMGKNAFGLGFYTTCQVHCVFQPFRLTCLYRSRLFSHVGHVESRKGQESTIILYYIFIFLSLTFKMTHRVTTDIGVGLGCGVCNGEAPRRMGEPTKNILNRPHQASRSAIPKPDAFLLGKFLSGY